MKSADLMPLNIIFIGSEEQWETDGMGRRTNLMFRALGRSPRVNKVLVVNCPLSLPSRLRAWFRGGKTIRKLYPLIDQGMGWEYCRIDEKITMLNLTALFPEKDSGLSKIERKLISKRLRNVLEKIDFSPTMSWIGTPRIVDIAKDLPVQFVVFDAVDNLLEHPQMNKFRRAVMDGYHWVDDHADLICAASKHQAEMFRSKENFLELPNAIHDIFLDPGSTVCPEDMAVIPKPRIIYTGVLQNRIDTELVSSVADQMRECQFIFVGPELVPAYFLPLKQKKNIHFLGPKKYELLPHYLKNADVCMIPHRINDFTKSMDPLKMYEYLACGRPVISTEVAGTQSFGEFIYTVKDAGTFTSSIRRALDENSPEKEAARRTAVAPHTWNARAESFLKEISRIRKEA